MASKKRDIEFSNVMRWFGGRANFPWKCQNKDPRQLSRAHERIKDTCKVLKIETGKDFNFIDYQLCTEYTPHGENSSLGKPQTL